MLQQDLDTQQDQDYTAGDLCLFLKSTTEHIANLDANSGKNAGSHTDQPHGGKDIDIASHSQGDTNSQCINDGSGPDYNTIFAEIGELPQTTVLRQIWTFAPCICILSAVPGYINNTQGELPVYLAGISMGATTVLMAAGLDLPDNVRGIVADCGFTSPHAIWKHVTEENLHLSYTFHGNLVERLCQKKLRMGTKEYSTIDAMKHCRVPVLFVHRAVPKNLFCSATPLWKWHFCCPGYCTRHIGRSWPGQCLAGVLVR